eukprot:snap_masked-scaffold_8-processed-gene-7.30-mRNA-1 protein AED:1.00 eAED:1.00 QI:0/-1/0/0/-1/1/1/0/1270
MNEDLKKKKLSILDDTDIKHEFIIERKTVTKNNNYVRAPDLVKKNLVQIATKRVNEVESEISFDNIFHSKRKRRRIERFGHNEMKNKNYKNEEEIEIKMETNKVKSNSKSATNSTLEQETQEILVTTRRKSSRIKNNSENNQSTSKPKCSIWDSKIKTRLRKSVFSKLKEGYLTSLEKKTKRGRFRSIQVELSKCGYQCIKLSKRPPLKVRKLLRNGNYLDFNWCWEEIFTLEGPDFRPIFLNGHEKGNLKLIDPVFLPYYDFWVAKHLPKKFTHSEFEDFFVRYFLQGESAQSLLERKIISFRKYFSKVRQKLSVFDEATEGNIEYEYNGIMNIEKICETIIEYSDFSWKTSFVITGYIARRLPKIVTACLESLDPSIVISRNLNTVRARVYRKLKGAVANAPGNVKFRTNYQSAGLFCYKLMATKETLSELSGVENGKERDKIINEYLSKLVSSLEESNMDMLQSLTRWKRCRHREEKEKVSISVEEAFESGLLDTTLTDGLISNLNFEFIQNRKAILRKRKKSRSKLGYNAKPDGFPVLETAEWTLDSVLSSFGNYISYPFEKVEIDTKRGSHILNTKTDEHLTSVLRAIEEGVFDRAVFTGIFLRYYENAPPNAPILKALQFRERYIFQSRFLALENFSKKNVPASLRRFKHGYATKIVQVFGGKALVSAGVLKTLVDGAVVDIRKLILRGALDRILLYLGSRVFLLFEPQAFSLVKEANKRLRFLRNKAEEMFSASPTQTESTIIENFTNKEVFVLGNRDINPWLNFLGLETASYNDLAKYYVKNGSLFEQISHKEVCSQSATRWEQNEQAVLDNDTRYKSWLLSNLTVGESLINRHLRFQWFLARSSTAAKEASVGRLTREYSFFYIRRINEYLDTSDDTGGAYWLYEWFQRLVADIIANTRRINSQPTYLKYPILPYNKVILKDSLIRLNLPRAKEKSRLNISDLKEAVRIAYMLRLSKKNKLNAVVFTGAGIGTGKGSALPTVRGEDPSTEFRQGKFVFDTSVLEKARPTLTHMVIKALVDTKYVSLVCTQNIENLHSLSGLKKEELWEVHGNIFDFICTNCKKVFDINEDPVPVDMLCPICSKEKKTQILSKLNRVQAEADTDEAKSEALVRELMAKRAKYTRHSGTLRRKVIRYYGENVDPPGYAHENLVKMRCCLVLGSSLKVGKISHFVAPAGAVDRPLLGIVNLGPTKERPDNYAKKHGVRMNAKSDSVMHAVSILLGIEKHVQEPPVNRRRIVPERGETELDLKRIFFGERTPAKR